MGKEQKARDLSHLIYPSEQSQNGEHSFIECATNQQTNRETDVTFNRCEQMKTLKSHFKNI